MKKFRTYKKYSLVYSLERKENAFNISIEKNSTSGVESSSYLVNGIEKDLKALLCRLWSCGVTPMSLVYILEDEGYIPQTVLSADEVETKKPVHIVRRKRPYTGKALHSVFEINNDTKPFATIGGDGEKTN